eukprot:g2467.t1
MSKTNSEGTIFGGGDDNDTSNNAIPLQHCNPLLKHSTESQRKRKLSMKKRASLSVSKALELPPRSNNNNSLNESNNTRYSQKQNRTRRLSIAAASKVKRRGSVRIMSSSDIVNIDEWVSDSKSKHCLLCGKGFTSRCNLKCRSGRHHCRFCGILACDECTMYRLHGARCCRDCKDTSHLQSSSKNKSGKSSEQYNGTNSKNNNATHHFALSIKQRRKLNAIRIFKEKGLIPPDTAIWVIWESFMLLLIAYETVTVPMQISIIRLLQDGWKIVAFDVIDYFVAVAFILDFLFRCRKTFIDPVTRTYCEDSNIVFFQYFKGRMVFDIVASIPMKYIVLPQYNNFVGTSLPRWVQLFVLFRLIRLPYLMGNVTEVLKSGNAFFRNITESLELFIYFFLLVHVAGCVFVFCALVDTHLGDYSVHRVGWLGYDGYSGMHDAGSFEVYITSIYWAFATTTTVGYGDVIPITIMEKTWTMVVMAGGNILSAFIMGTLAAGLSKTVDDRNERNKKFEAVAKYLNECNAPTQLMDIVKSYYDALWLINNSWLDEKPTDDLPLFLKTEINKCRHRQMLIRSPLIKCVMHDERSSAMAVIVQNFKTRILLSGQSVYEFGDVGEDIFMIRRGSVIRLDYKKGAEIGGNPLQIGDYFGDAFIPATVAVKEYLKFKTDGIKASYDKTFVFDGTNTRISTIMATSTTEFEMLNLADLKDIWEMYHTIQHVMSYIAMCRRMNLLDESEFDDHAVLRDSVNSFLNTIKDEISHTVLDASSNVTNNSHLSSLVLAKNAAKKIKDITRR